MNTAVLERAYQMSPLTGKIKSNQMQWSKSSFYYQYPWSLSGTVSGGCHWSWCMSFPNYCK